MLRTELGGEYMPNLHLQIHPVFIPMTSRVIIWDFRLRPPARMGHRGLRPGGISDLWNRYTLSINVEHRTSNIERRIMMTLRFIYFKTSEPHLAMSPVKSNFEG